MQPFEVRVDCASCNVEGATIETWDGMAAACRLGVPLSVRCRLCGHAAEAVVAGVEQAAPGDGCPGCGGPLDERHRDAHRCPVCGAHARLEERQPGRRFDAAPELERALATWAAEEGVGTAADLVEAYFVLPTKAEVFDALARQERVETSFDVADYLFSSGGAGGGAAGAATGQPAIMREEEAPKTERIPRPASLRRIGGPRDELLALASVAAADGEAGPDDLAVLLRAAGARGIPPLPPEDIRVWRPNEVDPPPTLTDRERVLEQMFQMAWSDGQMDDSELRVIRDYSRAWGIDPLRLKEWIELYSFGDANVFERWFRRFGLFLFPAR